MVSLGENQGGSSATFFSGDSGENPLLCPVQLPEAACILDLWPLLSSLSQKCCMSLIFFSVITSLTIARKDSLLLRTVVIRLSPRE